MTVEVRVDESTSPGIKATSDLLQGCTITPTLFNLYFNLVAKKWSSRYQPLGLEVLYRFRGKLVRKRMRSSKVAVPELNGG